MSLMLQFPDDPEISLENPTKSHLFAPRETMIAVLDLKDGQAVAARGGQRRRYRPLAEIYPKLSGQSPLELAVQIHSRWGIPQFYIADLDAIANQSNPCGVAQVAGHRGLQLAADLLARNFSVWLDVGLTLGSPELPRLLELTLTYPQRFHAIVASESLIVRPDWEQTLECLFQLHAWTISLDLRSEPGSLNWWTPFPLATAPRGPTIPQWVGVCQQAAVKRWIILSVNEVGKSDGPLHAATLVFDLIRELKDRDSDSIVCVGGGIHSQTKADLARAATADFLLVGTWFWEHL